MGLEGRDVRRIMGITQEAIRSTRYRIQLATKETLGSSKKDCPCFDAQEEYSGL